MGKFNNTIARVFESAKARKNTRKGKKQTDQIPEEPAVEENVNKSDKLAEKKIEQQVEERNSSSIRVEPALDVILEKETQEKLSKASVSERKSKEYTTDLNISINDSVLNEMIGLQSEEELIKQLENVSEKIVTANLDNVEDDTFQINMDSGETDEIAIFRRSVMSGIFSPLLIERMFKDSKKSGSHSNDKRESSTSQDSAGSNRKMVDKNKNKNKDRENSTEVGKNEEDSINRLLWGKEAEKINADKQREQYGKQEYEDSIGGSIISKERSINPRPDSAKGYIDSPENSPLENVLRKNILKKAKQEASSKHGTGRIESNASKVTNNRVSFVDTVKSGSKVDELRLLSTKGSIISVSSFEAKKNKSYRFRQENNESGNNRLRDLKKKSMPVGIYSSYTSGRPGIRVVSTATVSGTPAMRSARSGTKSRERNESKNMESSGLYRKKSNLSALTSLERSKMDEESFIHKNMSLARGKAMLTYDSDSNYTNYYSDEEISIESKITEEMQGLRMFGREGIEIDLSAGGKKVTDLSQTDGSSIASKKSTAPLLITPGDFNEPLPDRVGNMILDKKRKQWVNVNEYIPVEEDSDGNTRQLQSRYKAYSRSSTGVDRGGARSVYNNNSGGESSAPMLFGPESHRRGTIHTSNSYSKMNKDSDIKGYIASVSEEYFYNALNKKTMLATISDAGFEERKSSESEKRRNKSFAGEIDSLRKIIMTDNNLMHLNNKYFADTIERGLGRQETKRPPKINFTIDTNYNEQQGRDGAQELEDTLFSKIRSRNIAGEHLTILNLSGCGLRSLVGLSKHQPMLEYLNIQNNKISSVEGIPEDLVNLEAKNNWISFNDGKKFRLRDKLPHLEVVDMSNNQVSDIGVFSGLLHLRVLIIDKNQISTLSPLGRCTRLRKLSLAGNFVTQFDLDLREKMPRLEELDLSNNRIESLEAFTRFSSIKVLNLEANDIRNIGGTILTMPKLTALNLANNPKLFSSRSEALEALIRPEIFPALKTLRVDGCLLKTARSAIPKLQKLLIRGNLKTLDKPLEIYLDNTSLFSLKQLVISNRMLSIVDSMVNNSGWCMASLTRLELTFCGLTSLPSNFSQLFANLELLDLSGNTDLHELPMGLVNLHRLKVLRCQYTAIGCRDTLPAHKHSKGSLNSVYTTDLHKSADDSFVSDSSRISQHQLWPQLLSKKILSNMKNLVELDFRGCPLTQLIYSSKDPTPFTHFLNLISRPSMAATSLLKKNNQLNLLNSYSIKPLSRTHISEFDLDLLCQIESLFVCRQSVLDSLLSSPDLQILTPSVSSFSPSQLPAPSPLSDYHGDVAKNRHFSNSYSVYSAYSQSPISPPSSIASVSSSFSSTSSLNNFYTKPQLSSIANDKEPIPPTPSLYPYPSKSSSYELDSFYALDRSHCLLLEKSTLGSNLLFYRDFYRINVKNILPNLKFLDGLPTSV